MKTREEIVEEARTYIGTPFVHQGTRKGYGIDCDNFLINVYRFAGVIPPEAVFPNNYGRDEDGSLMIWFLENYGEQIDPKDAKPADMLAWIDERLAEPHKVRHLVMVTHALPDRRYVIHASERGVVEHIESAHFRRRIHSAWTARGLL